MHIILIKTGTFGNSEMESEEEDEGENNSINNTTQGPCTDANSPRTEKQDEQICAPEVFKKQLVFPKTLLG